MKHQIKNQKGSVGLIVLAILFFIVTTGVTVMIMSGTDFKTAYNVYMKSRADGLVDLALNEYRSRINNLLLDPNYFYVKDIDLSKLDKTPFEIQDNGQLKAKIDYSDLKFDTTNFQEDYDYLDNINNETTKNGTVLYKNPSIDTDYGIKDYESIVGSGAGSTSAAGIFNKAYNSNEFVLARSVFDSSNNFQGINIYSYMPMLEDKPDSPLFTVTRDDLEQQIKAKTGETNALSNINLNDDIVLSAVWDDNLNSPYIMVSITKDKANEVYVFTSTPLVDKKLNFFDKVIETNKLKKAEIKTVFDKNTNSVVAFLNTLVEDTNQVTSLHTFPIYLPINTTIDASQEVVKVLGNTSRTISTSVYWNPILRDSELMVFSVEDSNNGGVVDYNHKIKVYKMDFGIDNGLVDNGEIDISSLNLDYVNSIGSTVFWNSKLNDGVVNLIFSSPDSTNPEGQYKLYSLETNVVNADSTEIKEISLTNSGIKNVGKISTSGVFNEFGEQLVFVEKAIVKVEKVILTNANPQNITIYSYEDNLSNRVGAKTHITLKPEVEVTTVQDTNIRFIKSFKLNDLQVE